AREIAIGFQPRLESLVRGDEAPALKAGHFADIAADEAQLAAEIVKPGGQAGDADIDVACGRGDGNRLAGLEINRLNRKSFGGEVTLLERDEAWSAARQLDDPD